MLLVELAMARVVLNRARSNWFWGLVAMTAVVLLLIANVSGPDPVEALKSNRDNIFTLINTVGIILVIVTAATEIPRDISGRVVMIYLTKPISRWQVVVGKFFGIAAVGLFFGLVMTSIAIVMLYFFGMTPDLMWAHLFVGISLRLVLVAAAAAMAGASLTEMMSMVFTSGYAFLGFFINYINDLLTDQGLPQAARILFAVLIFIIPNTNTFSLPSDAIWNSPEQAADAGKPKTTKAGTKSKSTKKKSAGKKKTKPKKKSGKTSKKKSRQGKQRAALKKFADSNYEDPLGKQFKPVYFFNLQQFCRATLYTLMFSTALLLIGIFMFSRRIIA